MEFGVLYLPSGWHMECANEAQARDCFEHARKLLGHTDQQITATVYRRIGETVKPTK